MSKKMMNIFRLLILSVVFITGTVGCNSTETTSANDSVKQQVSEQRRNPSSREILPTPKLDEVSAGNDNVAIGDRRFWNEPVNTPDGFDKASRAMILLYALGLEKRQKRENESDKRASVEKWLAKELKLALQNYDNASQNCQENDWTCIGKSENIESLIANASKAEIPQWMKSWRTVNENFVRIYISEQIRLAALFPRTTSEIDLFNENEWNGDEVSDRKFFLTFDDGPTSAGGYTDKTLKMLSDEGKTAVFFVMGKGFSARQKNGKQLAELYKGQCIAAHGWEHISHQKGAKYGGGEWKNSVSDTIDLLKNKFSGTNSFLPLFRPPYGQRKPESGEFFQKASLQVALWNIDSQDWNDQISAVDIVNRMQTLMLIKRRGILLFHDVHPKAIDAVPVIIKELDNAVEWGKCQNIGKS